MPQSNTTSQVCWEISVLPDQEESSGAVGLSAASLGKEAQVLPRFDSKLSDLSYEATAQV